MTPPAPIDTKKRLLVIVRSDVGNCSHHLIGPGFGLTALKRKRFFVWTVLQSDIPLGVCDALEGSGKIGS